MSARDSAPSQPEHDRDPAERIGSTQGQAPTRRPTIEKTRTDAEIIIPKGHRPGEDFSPAQRAFYWLWWWIVHVISRVYFRADIRGRENVPTRGPCIISPIHRSNLDTPFTANVTRRRIRFMGKESLWKHPAMAWYLTMLGGFPVERATADREALRACTEILERGEALVMFPEGTRQSGPLVAEMFDGPAYLACRQQCPIVPVGLGGTEAAMPKGSKFPKPKRLTMVIGPPVMPPPAPPSGRMPRRVVREVTEELRDAIQAAFDEAQALAGTPNRHES